MKHKVVTHSRARRWWLERFHGYRVTRTASEPRAGFLGEITYRETWHLESADLSRLRDLEHHRPERSLRTCSVVASSRRPPLSTPRISLKH